MALDFETIKEDTCKKEDHFKIKDFCIDDWVWDQYHKSPEVMLSSDLNNAYFYVDPVYQSTGTAGVRGTKGFTNGEHYWEIIFLEPPAGTSVMVGVGTQNTLLHKSNHQYVNLIGLDQESWGLSYKGTIWHDGKCQEYCEPFFDKTTVIGCQLNLYEGTLTYYINGVSQGVAFHGLDKVNVPLYPVVSSTATETELGLGARTCRYLSLQEKCFLTIKKNLIISDYDRLPLPSVMKEHIKDM